MKGARILQEPPVYGTQGVSAWSNTPGARNSSMSWTDSDGNLWLFGGLGGDGADHNDLWRYSRSISQWTWVKGTNGNNQSGIYGSQGVGGATNTPGARDSAMSWSDNAGNLWLFGGYGRDSAGSEGSAERTLEDASASSQWTWIKGAKIVIRPRPMERRESPPQPIPPEHVIALFPGRMQSGTFGYSVE